MADNDESGRGPSGAMPGEAPVETRSERNSATDVRVLRAVLDHVPDFVVHVSREGIIRFVNTFLPGFDPQKVLGSSIFDYAAPEQRDVARAAFARTVDNAEPTSFESIGQGAFGASRHYLARLNPIVASGKVDSVVLIASDVTDLKTAQHELRETNEKLRVAISASGIGLWNWDPRRDELVMDETCASILGTDPGRAPKSYAEYRQLLGLEDAADLERNIRRALEIGVYADAEHTLRGADGRPRSVLLRAHVTHDSTGAVDRLLGAVVDLTERRRLEDQLRNAQKMEAIGQLTAGIAHNFNNMLAAILNSVEIAARHVSDPGRPLLDNARDAASRAAGLVRQLMVFASARERQRRVASDVGLVVGRTCELCASMFDRRVRLIVEMPDTLPPALIDPLHVEQALLNVLINARDALDGVEDREPVIRVAVSRGPSADSTPSAAGHLAATAHVKISVEDNGIGMDDETHARIFEPFFTTKDTTRGSGLGLATTEAIIRDHGGWLTCRSKAGVGTTMTFYLPVADADVPSAHAVESREPPPRGANAAVLLVDDEALVRVAMSRMLEDAGYRVRVAVDGLDALEQFRRIGAELDLVVMDHSMPRLSGEAATREIRQLRPDIKILGLSGGASVIAGASTVLAKPVRNDVLLAAVRELLDR